MREKRVTKRAVSDDFLGLERSYEESARAKISSEGALLGSPLGEAGLDAASAFPGPRDGDRLG